SIVPKRGEDEQKIENVGQLQVTENKNWVNKDDNALQLDQDFPPPLQYYCTNVPQFRKTKETIPHFGEWNNNLAQSQGHTTKSSGGIEVRRTPVCRMAPRRSDTTPPNYDMAPRIADSVRPLLSLKDDVYGGGTKSSRDPAASNYENAPRIINYFAADSGRPLPSINRDPWYGRAWDH
ncbi:hypothetical protein KSS87_018225, partial [Heliosperma pusillum]